jgi:uncharacterized membrane protein
LTGDPRRWSHRRNTAPSHSQTGKLFPTLLAGGHVVKANKAAGRTAHRASPKKSRPGNQATRQSRRWRDNQGFRDG